MEKKEIDLKKLRVEIEEIITNSNEFDRLDYTYDLKKVLGVIGGVTSGAAMMLNTDTVRKIGLDDLKNIFISFANMVIDAIEISEEIKKVTAEGQVAENALPSSPPQVEKPPVVKSRPISYVA